MASRVVQLDDRHFPALQRAGVPFKDVTERERHLKLTINRLKCDLAGGSARFFVVERAKFAALSRVASLAEGLPLGAMAERHPEHAVALRALEKELRGLGRLPEPRD